jgi:deoxyadenosine/deoxycytidine kinase
MDKKLEELILEEPKKISKEELDEVYDAYKTIERFCEHMKELSFYHLDYSTESHAKDLKRALRANLILLLRSIVKKKSMYLDFEPEDQRISASHFQAAERC